MSLLEKVPEKVRERWRTAGRFADVLETEVKARRSPLVARVVAWFNLCRLGQDLEEQMLFAKEPTVLECGDSRSLKPLGITADAVEAKIESLRITFEQWHTEINSERQEAVLKEVFGGET